MSGFLAESPLLTEAKSAFAELLQQGSLTITSSRFDEQAFGNAEVVLTGQNFRVRLVRDRGDVFADIGFRASADWRPLERALRALGASGVPTEGLLSTEQAAELVGRNLRLLELAFSPERLAKTERVLQKADEQATKEFQARWQTERRDES